MKAIFIAFDQAHYENIIEVLEKHNCRGFSSWELVKSRGSKTGDPHYGSHAWPAMSTSIMVMVEDEREAVVMEDLKKLDEETPRLGLRAWSWKIDNSI